MSRPYFPFPMPLSPVRNPDFVDRNAFTVNSGRGSSFGESGICVVCKEWTEVGASCCGRGVYFEGELIADREDGDE